MIDAHDTAARAAFCAAAGRRADELRIAIDPALRPSTPADHIASLAGSLGCLAFATDDTEREVLLVDHLAGVLAWADDLERDRRAA